MLVVSSPVPTQPAVGAAPASGRSADSWSARLWSAIAGPYTAVLEHPFLAGLADGSLPAAAFAGYLAQDAHYLRDYARALALLAARADRLADSAMLARHAVGAAEVELALHRDLLDAVGVDSTALESVPVSPTTYAYTRHLLSVTQQGSFADGLAAVLPCYWIYARVGQVLVEHGSPEPRYQRWIDTYAGEEFGAVVEAVLALVDRTGTGLTPEQQERSGREALTSARYEWMFWDAALRGERWPV
jgi:thiaminase/transcriptional activator TenA